MKPYGHNFPPAKTLTDHLRQAEKAVLFLFFLFFGFSFVFFFRRWRIIQYLCSNTDASNPPLNPRFVKEASLLNTLPIRAMGTLTDNEQQPDTNSPMPTYSPNLLISDCYGSAGSITFYHRDGKCRWRSKSTLSFAATPRQSAALRCPQAGSRSMAHNSGHRERENGTI